MGTDKALLCFKNETLLERLVRIVDPLVSAMVIMLAQTQVLPAGLNFNSRNIVFGRDKKKEQGPLQGIADGAALLPKTAEYSFVLSCDLPFLSGQWLKSILETMRALNGIDAVCSQLDNHINPLIAIYRSSVLREAQHYLDQGKSSCLVLLDNCKVFPIEPLKHQSDWVSNINTPEEYQKALLKLERES